MRFHWMMIGLGFSTTAAYAIAPSQHIYQGIEPQRIYPSDPASQFRTATAHSGWQRFLTTDGHGWQARFDLRLGSPLRMWGPGIDLGPVSNSTEVDTALSAFLDNHSDLLGVQPREWAFRSTRYSPETHTWYVDIDVLRGGAPLWRAGITARIKFGKLIALGAASYSDVPIINSVSISSLNAIQAAISEGPAPDASHDDIQTQLITLPEEVNGVVTLRLCWLVSSTTDAPIGQWKSFIDAQTGKLVSVYNDIRFLDGVITAKHDIRYPGLGTTTSEVPFARIEGASSTTYTDETGYFSLPDEASDVTAFLSGQSLTVINEGGADAEQSIDGDFLWTSSDASIAEIDAYIFLRQIQAWGASVVPSNGMVTNDLLAYVNINDTCNAYFDGNVSFFQSGGGCNNMARVQDIVFHEWGHGLHWYSLLIDNFDSSLSEGAADFTSALQTKDAHIAPSFYTNGNYLRNISPNRVYPDDLEGEVHADGLIFGGAMWDTWGLLNEKYGETEGTSEIARIFTGLLKGGPTISTSFDEAIIADDDDGNLGNGTPNLCEIIEGFEQHGLSSIHNLLRIEHDGSPSIATSTTPLIGIISNPAPTCIDFTPESATFHYRVDGGSWVELSAPVNSMQIEATLPDLALGSFVEYWFEAIGEDGTVVVAPQSMDIAPFTTYIGNVIPIHCEEFEASDGDFQSEALAGDDDWQWGAPQGIGGDPAAAWSGSHVWGSHLDGYYFSDIHTQITSPPWDIHNYSNVFLGYRRWLGVEDGRYDNATIFVNGEEVWTNHESSGGEQHTEDDRWIQHVLPIGTAATAETVQMTWELSSDGALEFGGWSIDNVCLYAPATPENQLQINDFVASDVGETIELGWTQPLFAPVTRVVVIRNTNDYPSDPEDGEIAYDSTEIAIGEPIVITDNVQGTFYYTVFASNGMDWYPQVIPGKNADIGNSQPIILTDDPSNPDSTTPFKGCGCHTGSSSGIGLFGLLSWMVVHLGSRRFRVNQRSFLANSADCSENTNNIIC